MILPPFFHFLVILASFFGIEILIVLDSDPRTAASGVWCTMFFIYMTYTLLTLHLQECAVAGLMLAITQLSAAASLNYNDPNMSKQVCTQQVFTIQSIAGGSINRYIKWYVFSREGNVLITTWLLHLFAVMHYLVCTISTILLTFLWNIYTTYILQKYL